MKLLTDLDQLVEKVRSSYVQEYLYEVLATYRAGAYRQAVAALWVVVCIDIIEKIRELSLAGDREAQEIERSIDAATDTKRMLEIESNLLNYAEGNLELISPIDKKFLERIKEDRNICVHPSFQKDGRHISIPAEVVRSHIVSACTILFVNAPTRGKVYLNQIYDRITEESFPTDKELAFTYLSSAAYLGRAKESLIRNIAVVLLKRLFKDTTQIDISGIQRLNAALSAISRINANAYATALRDNLSRLLAIADDNIIKRYFLFCSSDYSSWTFLDHALRVRIQHLISTLPADQVIKYKISEAAQNIEAIANELSRAVSRFEVADQEAVISHGSAKIFKALAIQHFIDSSSFDATYRIGTKVLIPHIDYFDQNDIKTLLEGAANNRGWRRINQVLPAGGVDEIFTALFSTCRQKNIAMQEWVDFWNIVKDKPHNFDVLWQAMADAGLIEYTAPVQNWPVAPPLT